MYKDYFNLKRNPFEVSPDPAFLFRTARQDEALAAMYHGIIRNKGFIVMTGEVGTGKTLALRCVARMLRPAQVSFAFIFNPLLTPLQFLQYIMADLGNLGGSTKEEMLHLLNRYLIARYQRNLTTALIVDEAHLLTNGILEEIRLLTNLESDRKLLQIVLAGQPELEEKLDSTELRQLKQRIAVRCRLEPLGERETQDYIWRRMEIAGAKDADRIFPESTVQAVYSYSRGIPRLVNTICENSLIECFASQTACVTRETIAEVAREFRLDVEPKPFVQQHSTPVKTAVEMLVDLLESLNSGQSTARQKVGAARERVI